jgi:leucyl aminopeptidase (aminopeptidase T)
MDMEEIVENVIFRCMEYKKGEKLLFVTDDKLYNLAQKFYLNSLKLGIDAVLIKYKPRKMHGEEPPEIVAKALINSDVALLITHCSLSHTKARKKASQKGVRIASLPKITEEIVKRTLEIGYKKLKKKIEKIANRLSEAKEILIKTKLGTNLRFSAKGRKGFADTGIYNKRGSFGNLPAGEACISPLENTAQGKIIFDASFAGIGKLSKPIETEVKDGYAVKISSKKLFNLLFPYGKKAFNIAEFGIGLNPKAIVTGNVLEDEKAINTSHIALGSNISFGGKINAHLHLDGVFYEPLILLDGKKLRI